jgi:tellurite resistance protein TerC
LVHDLPTLILAAVKTAGVILPDAPWWAWVVLAAVTAVMIVADIFYLNREGQVLSGRRILVNIVVVVTASCTFGVALLVLTQYGKAGVGAYFSGWLSETVLSVDNLFVMARMLHFFRIPAKYERKALIIGVLVAIVLRVACIFAGLTAIQHVMFLSAFFGLGLLASGVWSFITRNRPETPVEKSFSYRLMVWMKIPLSSDPEDTETGRLRVKRDGRSLLTGIGQCIIALGVSGLLFALDSIPVVLAVTGNLYLAVASNVMAVMGMLSIYAAYKKVAEKMPYIEHGVNIILDFVGIMLVIENAQFMGWFHLGHVEASTLFTMSFIGGILLVTWLAGLRVKTAE